MSEMETTEEMKSEDIIRGNVRLEFEPETETYIINVTGEDISTMTPASLLNLKNCILEDGDLEERAIVEIMRDFANDGVGAERSGDETEERNDEC